MFDNPALLAALMGSAFTPAHLFASGEQGVWYDPSDFSTMSQDDAGATPVTATGQAVGRILDKSGRGNHATQATPTSRPILRQDSGGRYYLEFDGTDDSLSTASITLGSVDKLQAFVGLRKMSDAAAGVVYETSANAGANSGTAALYAPSTPATANYQFFSRGTTGRTATPSPYAAPVTSVLSCASDISAPLINARVNGGVETFNSTLSQGTGNYLSNALHIGRRNGATVPFNGWLYGLIIRFSATNLDAASIANAERWMNGKTGAY